MLVRLLKNPVLIIVIITIFLSWQNYTPGTYLTGWDTLHPEFNFPLNFERLINGVWREEQGLGAVAGHSHMADLPRVLLLYLESFILPASLLRYSYFFISLLLGPLGVFYFLKVQILKGKLLPATLGALFYLLNLGTLQHFYVPFEMFAALYSTLPWLFLFTLNFLKNPSKKNLILYSIFTIISSPMAYAATLWYAFFANLLILGATHVLLQKNKLTHLKRLITLILCTLILNSYWLLPNLYHLKTSSIDVSNAKINQMFSQKAFLHDQKYANIKDALFLKSFLFDWQEYKNSNFAPLLETWQKHLSNPLVQSIGWIIAGVIIYGIVESLRSKTKATAPITLRLLLPGLMFSLAFLLHSHEPIKSIFAALRENSSLFKEGLRFPWTKFSIFVMFYYSIFFAFGTYKLSNKIKISYKYILFTFSFLLFTFSFPSFQGYLIDPSRRVKIPQAYFETINWFSQKDPSARIATFPLTTFKGWEYYNWNFEGAGFMWFGIKQPLLMRDLDRWEPSNENFYWEASHALYSKNLELLEKVLEKYQVSYLLADSNNIDPASSHALYLDELDELVSLSQKISFEKSFGNMKIYKVNLEPNSSKFISVKSNLPQVEPTYTWNNYDPAFEELGLYASTPVTRQPIYFPFRSLFTGKKPEQKEFTIEENEDYFIFSNPLPKESANLSLTAPQNDQELLFINPNDFSKKEVQKSLVELKEGKILVFVPKIKGYLSSYTDFSKPLPENVKISCEKSLPITKHVENLLELTSFKQECGISIELSHLPHEFAYIVKVESRNASGTPAVFWIENNTSRKPDIETNLPKSKNLKTSYFVQPPMAKDGLGYNIHLDNIPVGNENSINSFKSVSVYQIPYNLLTKISFRSSNTYSLKVPRLGTYVGKVDHPLPFIYKVKITNPQKGDTLILSQSFNPAWQAFNVTGNWRLEIGNLQNHILVNNWSNGWIIEENTNEVLIIYLPQLFEYAGFVAIALFAVYGLKYERAKI